MTRIFRKGQRSTKQKTNKQKKKKKRTLLLCGICLAAGSRGSVGAALRNDLAPECFVCVAESRDDQSELGRGAESTRWIINYGQTRSCIYCGAYSCTHWYVKNSVLYWIGFEMGNQCREHRALGEICSRSREFVLVTIRAASL